MLKMFSLVNLFPLDGQVMQFDFLSIVFIIIILISFVVGLSKGFLKSFLSFVVFFGAILIAIYVATPIANWLNGMSFHDQLYQWFYSWLSPGNEEAFAVIINQENKDVLLPQIFDAMHVPSNFIDLFSAYINSAIPQEGVEVGVFVCNMLTYYALVAAAFVISWLLSLIVLSIIKHIICKILKFKALKVIDVLLGGISGFAIGIFTCCLITFGIHFIVTINQDVYNFFNNLMALEDEGIYTISKMFYQENFIQQLIDLLK